jgi:Big-like domain-containing protein
MRAQRLLTVALTVALVSCEDAFLTAPPGSTLNISANPFFVAAHGGRSFLTAFLTEETGTAVPDGTVVHWFTDLGRVDAETRTRGGFAQANFVSDARSGVAHVRAISGPIQSTPASLDITVGNANVAAVRLRAVPPRIIESNSTHVIATVIDVDGNPVPNVPVTFRVVDDPATEFLESASAPVHTDNNGEAEDILRTRRNTVGVAEVQASVPGPGGSIIQADDPLRVPIL